MPKIVDHDEYRKELLEKCFDLFSSRGYANVTMRQIAGDLKISTGTLYHYFENKQTILQKMIEKIIREEIAHIMDIVYKTNDVAQRVSTFLGYFKEREEYFKKLLLLVNDFHRFCYSDENQIFLNDYAKTITDYVGEGAGVKKDFGIMIIAYLTGLGFMRLIVPDVIDVEQQMEIILKVALDYLGKESILMAPADL